VEKNCSLSLVSVVHSATRVCSVSSNPCTKYPFLGLGEQNSNPKVKNDMVVPRRANEIDDEVSLPPKLGENFSKQ